MSLDLASERVCYVHCNFCNTILAVNVPSCSLITMATVRCGQCANLLSVNMGASIQTIPPQDSQSQEVQLLGFEDSDNVCGSSSKRNKVTSFENLEDEPPSRMPPIRPPEKRQRVPSAYNRFIKEEIQRIKASRPDISHREAFSTAAKNWAHLPHIHFGLKLDGSNMQSNQSFTGNANQKHNGLYEINGTM